MISPLGLIDGFVIDHVDSAPESLPGVEFLTAPTLMRCTADRLQLARAVLKAADSMKKGRNPAIVTDVVGNPTR